MDISAIYNLGYIRYTIMISFMWIILLCLLNFYLRHGFSWLFMSILLCGLALNSIWHFNATVGNWLINEKPHWLASLDKSLPGILINQTVSTWVMFLFCLILFIVFVMILAQLVYRNSAFICGVTGLFIYIIIATLWMYAVLSANENVSIDVVSKIKDWLMITANFFLIISFTVSLKR